WHGCLRTRSGASAPHEPSFAGREPARIGRATRSTLPPRRSSAGWPPVRTGRPDAPVSIGGGPVDDKRHRDLAFASCSCFGVEGQTVRRDAVAAVALWRVLDQSALDHRGESLAHVVVATAASRRGILLRLLLRPLRGQGLVPPVTAAAVE